MNNDQKTAIIDRINVLKVRCEGCLARLQFHFETEDWDLLYHRADELKTIASVFRRDRKALADLE